MIKNSKSLLLEIAHCPNVELCYQLKDKNHPCFNIVTSQEQESLNRFQIPEPWSGRLATAPLLFLSSNPSISETEDYPLWSADEEDIEDFFVNRFSGGKKIYVKNGNSALTRDGNYLKATSYWSEIIKRSEELFGRNVEPGIDYALAEIVHCKSEANKGVKQAQEECIKQYFSRLLEESGAKVIVVNGKIAGKIVKNLIKASEDCNLFGPLVLGGKKRLVLFLPAPGSSYPRKIEKVYSKDEIEMIRYYLL